MQPEQTLLPLLKQPAVAQRTMGLIARVAQHADCAAQLVAAGLVPLVTRATSDEHGEAMQSASIRVLAVLASKTETAVSAMKELNFFESAADLLTLKNEAFAGNLSMLVSRVANDQANLSLFSRFVEPLVTIMHKTSGATQKNAAIACAKLARKPEYLQQIRDLHGIE